MLEPFLAMWSYMRPAIMINKKKRLFVFEAFDLDPKKSTSEQYSKTKIDVLLKPVVS